MATVAIGTIVESLAPVRDLLAAVVTDGVPWRLARAETSKGDVAKATITTVSRTLTRRTTTQGTSMHRASRRLLGAPWASHVSVLRHQRGEL
jgi:hypothetical protein